VVIYWLMFAWPAAVTFFFGDRVGAIRGRSAFTVLLLVFVILIGLRETGGDWLNYKDFVERISSMSFADARENTEFGFALVAWVSTQLGWDIYGLTTVCGLILMVGTVRFVRHQPDSWLAMTAAVPYLIIVIGMGYVRQSAAIGFILMALLDLESRKFWRFGLFISLAMLFHVSSLVLLPFLGAALARKRPLVLIPVILASIPAILYLSRGTFDRLMNDYIEAQYSSSGAVIRAMMNLVPSIIFLLRRRRFALGPDNNAIWTMLAATSCLLFVAVFVSPSSTLVDRLGLYLLPIQLMVAGHLPAIMSSKPSDARLINFAAVTYFGLVQLVWLTFADNAYAWLPYKSLLTS
jgi:hypothetical protein